MANLGFQRGPGQDLVENGPFAFKPHKEFIEKKCFHFGKFGLQNRPNDNFGFKTAICSFKMANFGFETAQSRLQMANLGFQRGPGQDLAENGFKMVDFSFKGNILKDFG